MKEGIETSYSLPAIAPVASTAVVVGEGGGSKLAGGRYGGRNKSVASKGKTKAAAAIAIVGSPVLSAPSSMVSAGTEEPQFVTPPAPPSFKGKNALFRLFE